MSGPGSSKQKYRKKVNRIYDFLRPPHQPHSGFLVPAGQTGGIRSAFSRVGGGGGVQGGGGAVWGGRWEETAGANGRVCSLLKNLNPRVPPNPRSNHSVLFLHCLFEATQQHSPFILHPLTPLTSESHPSLTSVSRKVLKVLPQQNLPSVS